MNDNKVINVEAYAGYKQGETPRRVFINGAELDIEYIVFRNRVLDMETNEYSDHFRLKLKNYGECDIMYRELSNAWELKDVKTDAVPFSHRFRDS